MNKIKIPAFWQAVLVVFLAWLFFGNAFPPLIPKSLMVQFMIITIIGVLLYFSFDDERWAEFMAPILSVLRDDNKQLVRAAFLIAIPGLIGYTVYGMVKPTLEAPVELRQVHPAPPSKLKVFNKTFDLTTLENPVRAQVLAQIGTDKEQAMATYNEAVASGSEVYYKNCFYCHGDLLDGDGPFAKAFNPLPANFQDIGTIAQLEEGFLFWRITTGGPGLPKEGTPWNSAMPVWHEIISEEEVWNVITFLYDYVGQVPRMWDQDTSRQVTNIKDEIQAQRTTMDGKQLYQHRCAVCHGEEGLGDGPAADFLYPRPRDFSTATFKYKSTPGTDPARDDDVFNTIKHGLNATGMPGWSSLLSDAQIISLIPVIKSFDISATWAPEEAEDEDYDDEGRYLKDDFVQFDELEPMEGQIPYSEESLVEGKKVFDKTCVQCHGDEGRGNITSGKRLADDWEFRIWPRDLGKPWTWRTTNVAGDDEVARDQTIRNIYQRLSIGITGTPMPAHRAEEGSSDALTLEQRWHVANYVYALRNDAAPPPGQTSVIKGVFIAGALPTEANDAAWDQATPVTFTLAPNIIKDERLFTPLNDAVTVQALYNEQDIAFKLTLNDRTDSRPGEEVSDQIQDEALDMFSDAFAIQFPKQDSFASVPVVEKPLYRHGDTSHPTTIWYWNAGSIEPESKPATMLFDASGPDKKLVPRQDDASLNANGAWEHGRWQVIMQRPRRDDAHGDIQFEKGQYMPISFANWDGSNGEKGARHTLTSWFWLLLPPEIDNLRVYGIPAGTVCIMFILGLLLIRSQRNKRET
jgi:DMSO reductase family type II enzyme heme b subunit